MDFPRTSDDMEEVPVQWYRVVDKQSNEQDNGVTDGIFSYTNLGNRRKFFERTE